MNWGLESGQGGQVGDTGKSHLCWERSIDIYCMHRANSSTWQDPQIPTIREYQNPFVAIHLFHLPLGINKKVSHHFLIV